MKTVAALLGLALCALPMIAAGQPVAQGGRVPEFWTYRNPTAALSRYSAFIVPPADAYPSLSDWGGAAPGQRQAYAAAFTEAVRRELGRSYRLVDAKGPGVGLLRITLLDVRPPQPGVSTGAVQVSLHLTDSTTGEVLATLIRERSPDAADTPTTEALVRAVGTDVGVAIRRALDEAHRP